MSRYTQFFAIIEPNVTYIARRIRCLYFDLSIAVKIVLGMILAGILSTCLVVQQESGILEDFFADYQTYDLNQRTDMIHNHFQHMVHLHQAAAALYGSNDQLRGHLGQLQSWTGIAASEPRAYQKSPPWLPDETIQKSMSPYKYALLFDSTDGLREFFSEDGSEPPVALKDPSLLSRISDPRPLIVTIGNSLMLLSAAPFQFKEFPGMEGLLLLATPVMDLLQDSDKQEKQKIRWIKAVIDEDHSQVMASSNHDAVPLLSSLASVENQFLVSHSRLSGMNITQQPVMYVVFVYRSDIQKLIQPVLQGAHWANLLSIILFTLICSLMVQHIRVSLRSLLEELSAFRQIALGDHIISEPKGNEVNNLRYVCQHLEQKIIQFLVMHEAIRYHEIRQGRIANLLEGSGNLVKILGQVLEEILSMPNFAELSTGGIVLLQSEDYPEAARFRWEARIGELTAFPEPFSSESLQASNVFNTLLAADGPYLHAAGQRHTIKSDCWITPLKFENRLYGAMIILTVPETKLKQDHLVALSRLGEMLAVHVQTTHMHENLVRTNETLSQTLEQMSSTSAALENSERRQSNLIAMLPLVLIEVDGCGEISRWNQLAEKYFGFAAETVLGMPLTSLSIPWDVNQITNALLQMPQTRNNVYLERFPYWTGKRQEGFLSVVLTPMLHIGENAFLFLGKEITENVQMELRLAQAEKLNAIGSLAAGIAHEINTPAQFLSDNSQFLKDAFSDLTRVYQAWRETGTLLLAGKHDQAREQAEQVEVQESEMDMDYLMREIPGALLNLRQGVERISTIVKAMKNFSYQDRSNAEPMDLNKIIQDTAIIARNEYKYVADLELKLLPGLPMVTGFRSELHQVILNLLVNASHAIADKLQTQSGERGTITLQTELMNDKVMVRVVDTGTGIPEKIQHRIFEPFFTTKPVGKGTGQGLAITHDIIVRKHGGTIHVTSIPGQGTTFTICLPRESSETNDSTGNNHE